MTKDIAAAKGRLKEVHFADLPQYLHKLSDEEVETLFVDLRAEITKRCADNRGHAASFHPIFSASWISDLRKPVDDYPHSKVKRIARERLLWHDRMPTSSSIYRQLADYIGQDESEKAPILKKYTGKYRYFRYASIDGKFDYVSGRIEIMNSEGDPAFGHWSHNWTNPEPEHQGFVYRSGNHIFMPGQAAGVMRLAIAREMRGKASTGCMPGLVLSMRNDPTNDPFAARFLLVPTANKLVDRLMPGSDGAEALFNELTHHSEDKHYMLIG